MMFVDDISYTPASASELDIKGYNVWRDGTLVGTVGADVTSFTDEAPDCADPAYVLTVLYDKGESAPTEEVHISAAGRGAASMRIPVAPGIYIVTAGDVVAKVAVE